MKRHELIRDHIKRIGPRYRDADKRVKKTILDEFCHTWGIGRKYAIRLLGGKRLPTGKKAGRPPRYDGRLVKHLTVLWDSMERICPKRMKAALPIWLPFYRDPELDPKLKAEMLKMSASTIGRFLKRGRKTLKGLSGEFANTLTVTDRLSTWTENCAILSKNRHEMVKALRMIETRLPFKLLSIQNDCGTEFLNYVVMRYLHSRPAPVIMTRSRPYHKNDNAHVEQKNNTHVRGVFGYDRIEQASLVDLMNEIYRDYWNPLHNFFLPSMKLREKERNGARITKRYDDPKTPFERLMLAPNLSEEKKQELRVRFKRLNPFELKLGLERKLELFFSLLRQGKAEKKAA